MKVIEPQRVSVAELFYDLIFVYAVSLISKTISELNYNEVVPLESLGKFLMIFLVFWSIWTYQMVYSNRFFKPTLKNYVFIFINMFLVIIISQSINLNFQQTHFSFIGGTTLLFFSISLQYWFQYIENSDSDVKELCSNISLTALVGAILGIISLCLPAPYNIKLYFLSILFLSFFPIFYRKILSKVPTNFEHLLERYSLFVILLFGESIVGVAKTISYNHISFNSFLYFSITVMLFAFYMMNYTLGLDHHIKTNGVPIMLTHLFLFISIDLMTVLLEKFTHEPINSLFFIGLFYASLFVFVLSTLMNLKIYHKSTLEYTSSYRNSIVIIVLISMSIALFTQKFITATMVVINTTLLFLLYTQWKYALNKGEIG